MKLNRITKVRVYYELAGALDATYSEYIRPLDPIIKDILGEERGKVFTSTYTELIGILREEAMKELTK